MNKVILMGRLTRDPELRTTQSNVPVCSFTLAVDRRFKNANGERQADFISCTAWRQTAEFVTRYFSQGSRLALVGSIQTSSWEDNEGKRQYRTDVIADEVYFADSKRGGGEGPYNDNPAGGGNYASNRRSPGYGAANSNQSQDGAASAAGQPAPSFEDAFVPGSDDNTFLPFDL